MSDYLSKQAVLEWLEQNAVIFFDLDSYHVFRNAVLSGAFDVEYESAWKAIAEILGQENSQMSSKIEQLLCKLKEIDGKRQFIEAENERLRAALEGIHDHATQFGYATICLKAEKALSTTTE